MNKFLLVLLAVTIVACGDDADAPVQIANAAETCGVEMSADERSIALDTRGEDEAVGDSYEDVACVLIALDAPDHVISRMDGTRALDGTLEATWMQDRAEIGAFWTYHPDDGLRLVVFDDRP